MKALPINKTVFVFSTNHYCVLNKTMRIVFSEFVSEMGQRTSLFPMFQIHFCYPFGFAMWVYNEIDNYEVS